MFYKIRIQTSLNWTCPIQFAADPPSFVVLTSFPSRISITCPAPTGIGAYAAFFSSLSCSPFSPSFSGHVNLLSVSSVPWTPSHLNVTHTLYGKASGVSMASSSLHTSLICAHFRTHVGHCLREAILHTPSLAILDGVCFPGTPFFSLRALITLVITVYCQF